MRGMLAYTHCRSEDYGPCVGVSRLERWERAYMLDLNPPPEVSIRRILLESALLTASYRSEIYY